MEGLSFCFVGRCALSSIVAAGYLVAQVALGILRASVRIKTVGVGNRSDLEKGETALLDTRESSEGPVGRKLEPALSHHRSVTEFRIRTEIAQQSN